MRTRLFTRNPAAKIGLALLLALLAFHASAEDIFKYTDKQGVIHLSNRRLNNNFKPFYYLQMPSDVDQGQVMAFVRYYCRRHGMDPELVRAVVEVESGFDFHAVSAKGAQGLMQIMPDTGKGLNLDNPFDPAHNLETGIRYLKAMLAKFGDVRLALAAYNAGPGRVSREGGVPPIAETENYVKKVLARYGKY
jgi:soluble lytic murein transglycosylase-like protein